MYLLLANSAVSFCFGLSWHISAKEIVDGGVYLPFSSIVSVLCSLARCDVFADDADLSVSDNLSGFRLSEVPDNASLPSFSGFRELAAASGKEFSELTQTLSFYGSYCLEKDGFCFVIHLNLVSPLYGSYVWAIV